MANSKNSERYDTFIDAFEEDGKYYVKEHDRKLHPSGWSWFLEHPKHERSFKPRTLVRGAHRAFDIIEAREKLNALEGCEGYNDGRITTLSSDGHVVSEGYLPVRRAA